MTDQEIRDLMNEEVMSDGRFGKKVLGCKCEYNFTCRKCLTRPLKEIE